MRDFRILPIPHTSSKANLEPVPFHSDGPNGDGLSGSGRTYSRKTRCLWSFFLLTTCLSLGYFLRDSVRWILVVVEHQDDWTIMTALILLYILVSMPFAWGYIVINVATGYLYGFVKGILVTIVTATIGILVAFLIVRKFLGPCVRGWIIETNKITKSIDQMLYNPSQAFKIIVLCRLTPIPFGLQNSLFSVNESLSAWLYCYATFLGLMPFQVLNVYLGSTLRSMEQVLYDATMAKVGMAMFGVQILVAILVTYFVLRAAETELKKAISESKISIRSSINHDDLDASTSLSPKDTDPLLPTIEANTLSEVIVSRTIS